MIKFEGKDNINTLLNIDNYFGQHEGSMVPMLLFFAGAGIPLLGWLFLLSGIVPLKFFIVPWLLWTGRWALKTLGREDKKMKDFLQQREDVYKAMDDLVHINQLYKDGLIEYSNGFVGYLITGFPKQYLNCKKLSADLEEFMNELDMWVWDLYLHNAIDEVITEDELPKLKRYVDEQVIQDRISFFAYQDEYSRNNTALYRYTFLVCSTKANWKKLRTHLENLMESETVQCFNSMKICDRGEVNDLINRDVCSYTDFVKMLTKKYENNDFNGSKVLWYDDKIPKKYKKKNTETSDNIEERRVVDNND